MKNKGANYKVRDINLAEAGRKKIMWAESRMPVLMELRKRHSKSKPLKGARIAGCLHVTKETAVLVETLVALGAEVSWSGCNPLSTQDEIAAALAREGISIYAWHGMSVEEFYWAIRQTIETLKPTLTLDDGADLIFTLHNKYPEFARTVKGGTEETTTGVKRLRAMAKEKALLYPVIAVNDAETKWDFDNIYGTGQSSIDGIVRSTNVLLAGKIFVVAGYGHCGKGVAMRAKGMGARVIITEVRPTAALKAVMDGMDVMPMEEAAKIGDIFITATGIKDIITGKHFDLMKDGAIVCNTGHYDCEVKIPDLYARAESVDEIRPNNKKFKLKDGRSIYLLADGRLVNLAGAEGHPSEVMDMSFSNQLLALKWLHENERKKPDLYTLPPEQDEEIATLKLKTMGITTDTMTEEQKNYAEDWKSGT